MITFQNFNKTGLKKNPGTRKSSIGQFMKLIQMLGNKSKEKWGKKKEKGKRKGHSMFEIGGLHKLRMVEGGT